jgi:hypothetical protein
VSLHPAGMAVFSRQAALGSDPLYSSINRTQILLQHTATITLKPSSRQFLKNPGG